MKSRRLFHNDRTRWYWASLIGLGVEVSSLAAAESTAPPASGTNAPPAGAKPAAPAAAPAPLTPEQSFEGGSESYNNWIDLGVGGFLTKGNSAQFQQGQQSPNGAFGGLQDFHYQGNLDKKTTVSVDGHAIVDNEDYKVNLGVTREKFGFLRFSYNQFRTWSNGDGGFSPPADLYFPLSGNALALDRGQIAFEAGLTLPNLPKIVFKYTHTSRDGDKGSTIWGDTHPVGSDPRGLSPTINSIDEHSDAVQLDLTHHIKATEFGLGVRYEFGSLDNRLKIDQFPGESGEQKITDRQQTSYDLFNTHFSTETWLSKKAMLSSGLSYSDLDNTFAGSRIYGSTFGAPYVPNPQQTGFGYYGLAGGSRLDEYVMNLNLLTLPLPHLSIVPSIRVQKEDADGSSSGFETLLGGPAAPLLANSDRGLLDVRERLDVLYNGMTNWVLYGRGEFTEGNGNLQASGGSGYVSGIGVPPLAEDFNDTHFFQKYSLGARWYPSRRASLDFGGYYKSSEYHYDNLDVPSDSSDWYPAYLRMQDLETWDGNIRFTLRPWQKVTLVSRYEYQFSTIHTMPDAALTGLPEVESSRMTSHILAQDVSWSPWSRLYLQAGVNYVLSDTKTPGSEIVQGILKSQNNYWTLNFSSSFVLDDKTDLNLGYVFYQADNYNNDSAVGVPYGAGAEQHSVTATLVRRISKHLRMTLKYGFYHYDDVSFGGNRDYDAHLVFSSLQYRF